MLSKLWLQFRYYRVLSKALLGFSALVSVDTKAVVESSENYSK